MDPLVASSERFLTLLRTDHFFVLKSLIIFISRDFFEDVFLLNDIKIALLHLFF